MEQIRKMFKQLRWFAITIVACNVILICTLLFYNPLGKISLKDADYLQEVRKVETRLQEAKQNLSDEREKFIQQTYRSDSITVSEIKINRDEISKIKHFNIKDNEKIRNISRYSSNDITRAFAELKDN